MTTATNNEMIADELAQCEAQLAAAMRILPLRTGEKKTATEYKITFLTAKIERLAEILK